jgi:hypothetical protein
MKQRITVEQLNELTDDQKKRLREWWKPWPADVVLYGEKEDLIIYNHNTRSHLYEQDWLIEKDHLLPLLSIGQMIELTESTNIIKYNGGWSLEEDAISFHTELCDALWEAVKQML